ncbi:SDR family oxidoreductase [Legionella jordanis]|uniref:Oxidoreductase n=1 Tax=Legionella jordanis TaxID=456 RepID=A0A0W0VE88_9GAMM|nr:SDR family oxidoreductase [Legionella jordanis]KTD18446.1 oxidoreductase [Legionella jordanis]RMX05351.1 SDR family oxidoreductase [Legionella jordanis]RMX20800.1 SDR family oxidoreductase [Legionella jordanis]VEH13206.1 oxidoreductase [Legionella jordanis]
MRTILITGSNRGIGLELVRQLSQKGEKIFATCREPAAASELSDLAKQYSNISIYPLDISRDESIKNLFDELQGESLDWLINNAGISGESGVTVGHIDRDNFLNVMNINCLSPLKVSDTFLPLLHKGKEKLIINISSRMGSIGDNSWGRSYAYRASKAALNCVMRSFALDVAEKDIKVMLLHPGWVKTDLGGSNAEINVHDSVASMLNVIELYKKDSHGETLRSYTGEIIPW